MKTIVIGFLLAGSYTGFAQVSKNNSPICRPCAVLFATSISQVEDVKKTDTYYTALAGLIEKYGIDLAPCDNKNLGGSLTLTTAMVIPMLNTALDRMTEVINEAAVPLKDDKREELYSKLMPHQFDMYKHLFTSASQVVGLKYNCFYFAARHNQRNCCNSHSRIKTFRRNNFLNIERNVLYNILGNQYIHNTDHTCRRDISLGYRESAY